MGRLVFDHAGTSVDLEDRVLLHLQAAIGTKLRRGERFFLTWSVDAISSSRQVSTWVSPRSPLSFRYTGDHLPRMNHQWVDALVKDASRSGEMRVLPEPAPAHPDAMS